MDPDPYEALSFCSLEGRGFDLGEVDYASCYLKFAYLIPLLAFRRAIDLSKPECFGVAFKAWHIYYFLITCPGRFVQYPINSNLGWRRRRKRRRGRRGRGEEEEASFAVFQRFFGIFHRIAVSSFVTSDLWSYLSMTIHTARWTIWRYRPSVSDDLPTVCDERSDWRETCKPWTYSVFGPVGDCLRMSSLGLSLMVSLFTWLLQYRPDITVTPK